MGEATGDTVRWDMTEEEEGWGMTTSHPHSSEAKMSGLVIASVSCHTSRAYFLVLKSLF